VVPTITEGENCPIICKQITGENKTVGDAATEAAGPGTTLLV